MAIDTNSPQDKASGTTEGTRDKAQAATSSGEALQLTQSVGTPGSVSVAVTITAPPAGGRTEVTVEPGGRLVFQGVDLATAQIQQFEGGLLITLANGGTIFLAGYTAATESANPPVIEVAGIGTIDAGQLLAATSGANLDIAPAAGPAAGVAHGGGAAFVTFTPGVIGDGLAQGSLQPNEDFLRSPPEHETIPVAEDEEVAEAASVLKSEFSIQISGASSSGAPAQTVTLQEDSSESAEVTITMSGDPLAAGQMATVVITIGGDTENGAPNGDFTQAVADAIAAAANSVNIDAVVSGNTVTLTWDAADPSSFSVLLIANDDALLDSPETLTLTLSDPARSGGTATIVGGADQATATIEDLDQDITISISDTQASISEEAGASDVFTISLSEAMAAGNTVTVDVDFATGTDAEDADFAAAAQAALQAAADATAGVSFDGTTLTFTDAFIGTGLSFTVTAADDDLTDSPETLNITLSNATAVNGTATAADAESVTITDADQDIVISIADTQASISEEAGGSDVFTISLSEAMAAGNTVTVDVDFATGTDAEDADFVAAAQAALQAAADTTAGVSFDGTTLTFTDAFAGTDLAFTVTAADDDLTDSPETLNITLSNATAVNGTATAADAESVTITDLDQDITISISDTQASISEEAGGSDVFTISLSQPVAAGNTITVDVDFATGTDAEDADFVAAAQAALQAAADATAGVSFDGTTLTFTDAFAGTDLAFTVTAADDDLTDSPETLNITLSNATAVNGTATAADAESITITDLDQDITISISDTQAAISEESAGSDTFTISLSQPVAAGNTVTVDVDFATGTDTEDADFAAAAQAALQAAADATAGVSFDGTTLTFTDAFAGTDLSFTVTAADDDLTDSPETLNITLSNATAVNGTATAADAESVTITDADKDIVISIADTQASISEEAGGSDVFTISLNQPIAAGNTVTVDVDFATGTDAEDADFVTAAQAALQAVADATAGVSFDGTTLTFTDTFVGTDLSFTVTAADDDLTDSPETLTVTLSNATAVSGTATAADAESVTITDIDSSMSFAVTVDDEGGEPAGAVVSISEENLADNAATFTIEMSGTLASGNSASVVLSFPGTAGDGTDYSPAIETAIANAIAALAADPNNPTYDAGTNTLTFFGGGPTELSFVATATDDSELDPGETIVVNLVSASIVAGPTPSITAPTAVATIEDTDAILLQELNGLITTNKNSTAGAKLLLTFTEVANPTNSFQALITIPTGGQKDSSIVIQELTGFTIDNTKQYAVTLEWVDQGNSDEKIIVTSVTLEDVVIQSSGTHQLGDPTASPGGDTKAISAVIVPADPLTHTGGALVQGFTDSIDGTSGNDNPLSDPSPITNYVFGAAGNDILEGDSGMSILDGGAGDNILNGNDGNDILVWDRADLTFDDTYDGGVGTDTLRIDGNGVSLDLSALTNTASLGIASIEVIDLTGTASSGPDNPSTLVVETSGSNVLTLAAEDVIEHSTDNVLTVLGDGNDVVNLQGTWTDAGVAASGFHVYTSTVGPTMVTVQVDAEIVNVNATIV
jgi:Fe-S cluster assembly iron-binding protein IscA